MKSTHNKQSAFVTSQGSFTEILISLNEKKYRSQQIYEGLYQNFYSSWEEFSSLPKPLRQSLENLLIIHSLIPDQVLKSEDQTTQKTLYILDDGFPIESVLMRNRKRNTLCVSTQSGCAMKCVFCATGTLGLNRSLESWEIVEQVIYAQRYLHNQGTLLTNIVLMGMGEPFQNYENVMEAIRIINNPKGLNFGARRITISTIGLINALQRFIREDIQVNLAVSLHAPDDLLRSTLVPTNSANPISALMPLLNDYISSSHRRVSIEYVLIRDINDSPLCAQKLVSLLRNNLFHVNLIPLNPTSGYDHLPPEKPTLLRFANILRNGNIQVSIRRSQGAEILAGCGQLAAQPS